MPVRLVHSRGDFGHLELEFVKAEQRLDLFILGDAVGELRRHEDLVGAVMLELCDGIAYGTGVSVRLGGVCAHAHDAIKTFKANHLVRLLKIRGEALQQAGAHGCISHDAPLEFGVTAREAHDACPRQLEQLGMDAAEGAPRTDKGFVAVGDKRANCLCNCLVGIGDRSRSSSGSSWASLGSCQASVPSISKKQMSPCLWAALAAGEAEAMGANPGSRPII